MPISRFVAVSLSPASSVFRSTFVRTGRERFETARLTTERPRARFSCMTDSFTLDSLPQVTEPGRSGGERGRADRSMGRGYLLPIFSSRHHRHHAVDAVDGHERPLGVEA